MLSDLYSLVTYHCYLQNKNSKIGMFLYQKIDDSEYIFNYVIHLVFYINHDYAIQYYSMNYGEKYSKHLCIPQFDYQ